MFAPAAAAAAAAAAPSPAHLSHSCISNTARDALDASKQNTLFETETTTATTYHTHTPIVRQTNTQNSGHTWGTTTISKNKTANKNNDCAHTEDVLHVATGNGNRWGDPPQQEMQQKADNNHNEWT